MRKLMLVAVALLFLVGCEVGSKKHSIEQEKAHTAVTLGKHTSQQLSPAVPINPAPSGKCTNCNGTGKIGDGRTMLTCTVCGGDGVVTPGAAAAEPTEPAEAEGTEEEPQAEAVASEATEPVAVTEEQPPTAEPPVVTPEPDPEITEPSLPAAPAIVMYTRPSCIPCSTWWIVDRPRWQASGWSVERREYSGLRSTPWYLVIDSTGTIEIEGYLTDQRYRAAKAQRQ